jgi:hypothetical protein
MKLALTEDNPTIKPYDEALWAETPDVRGTPIATSLVLLDALHQRWVTLLRGLRPADFARPFVHPASGPWTIGGYVRFIPGTASTTWRTSPGCVGE